MSASNRFQDQGEASHLLYFHSLFREGRALAFPCDAEGQVDLDRLSDRARTNYFYARSVIGREFHGPEVQTVAAVH